MRVQAQWVSIWSQLGRESSGLALPTLANNVCAVLLLLRRGHGLVLGNAMVNSKF